MTPDEDLSVRRVLFLDHGQFGFKTHGEGLAHFADKASFATVHRSEQLRSANTPDAIVGDRAAGANLNSLIGRSKDSAIADAIRRRREGSRLRAALHAVGAFDDKRGQVTHLHAFPLLAAHPPTLRDCGISWSLGMDATAHQRLSDFAPHNLTAAGRASRLRLIAHERVICGGATFIAATSQYCADSLVHDYGISPDRIEIIPHCIKPIPRPPESADRLTGPLLFVGDNLDMKGFPRLLDWHQREFADRVELQVVSRDPRPADLASLRNVRWLGQVANEQLRAETMPSARALVLPTSQDMSPMVLLEAAAAALPAIATNLAGIPELIDDGRTGFVIDRDDDSGWRQAIGRLVDDDELAGSMSQAAALHFAESLDGERVAQALFDTIAQRVLTNDAS